MIKGIKKAVRSLALLMALCATSGAWAAAPTPVAEWDGDLANDSTKGKYTMSVDSGDSSVVSFSDNKATLTSSTDVASKGVQISWPDPTGDAGSFISKKMSVVIQYSGLSIPSGNTSLLGLPWNSTTSEYVVYSTSGNGKTCLATGVTSDGAGSQWGPSVETSAPTKGKMLVTFSGDSSYRPGVDLYFSTYNDATSTYGDYVRIGYWSDKKIDNGTFYGLKVGGTIASTGKYFRPGMTVESVQVYDDVVVASVASMSSSASWSELVWDKDKPDWVPASLYTYIVNVTDDATLDLTGATITAESVIFNIASGKKLTLTGTVASSSAPIFVQGGGELNLTSDPGCTIRVSSGAEATISGGETEGAEVTIASPLKISGTLKTKGYLYFSNTTASNNEFDYGSLIEVVSGQVRIATYSSGYSGGFAGTVTIDPDATLVVMATDTLKRNPSNQVVFNVYGNLKFNSTRWTVQEESKHLFNFYPGSKIIGAGDSNGTLDFESASCKLNVYNVNKAGDTVVGGVVTFEPRVKCRASGVEFNVAEGTTLILNEKPNSGYPKKAGTGTLRLVNQRLESGYTGSEGTIELISSGTRNTGNHSHTFASSPYSGKLKVTTDATAIQVFGWVGTLSNKIFTNRPEFEVNGDVRIYKSPSDKPFTVKNLSGSGSLMNDNTYDDTSSYKYFDVLQTADTEYAGVFAKNTIAAADITLTVRGENEGDLHSLTLTGVSDTMGPLTIENNAKVVFSSTGKWSGGTVTVKNGGVLESQNTAAISPNLKVEEGATLKFASGVELLASKYDWTSVSADESVNIDLSAVAPSATPVVLIASGVDVDGSKFAPVNATEPVALSVDGDALKVTFTNNRFEDGTWTAGPTTGNATTVVLSDDATMSIPNDLSLGAITVETATDNPVTLTVSGAGTLTSTSISLPANVTLRIAQAGNWNVPISGSGKVEVAANTVTFTTANTFTGGLKVLSGGVAKTTSQTGFGGTGTAPRTGSITVEDGGSLDVGNAYSDGCYALMIAGNGVSDGNGGSLGAVFNSVAVSDYHTQRQTTSITLTGDATIVCDNDWGLVASGYGNTTLTLGTYTLTKAGTANFYICNTRVAGSGNIDIVAGAIKTTSYGSEVDYNQAAGTWCVRDGASLLIDGANLSYVKTLQCDAGGVVSISSGRKFTSENSGTITINGTMNITGELQIGYDSSSTLAVGGTINLTGTSSMLLKEGSSVTRSGTGTISIGPNANVTWEKYSWTSSTGDVFSGSGTLELQANTDAFSPCTTTSAFAGKLNVVGNTSKVPYFGAGSHQFSDKPEFRLTSYMTLNNNFIGESNAFTVKNLTGASGSRVDPYNNSGYNGERYISTLQTTETTFEGNFTGDASRKTALHVYGEAATGEHSLTLTAANDTPGSLIVDAYSKVIFSDSGSWLSGGTTVRDGGVLESQRDAKVVGKLTLEADSTLSFAEGYSLQVDSIEFPEEGKVTIDVSGLASMPTATTGVTLLTSANMFTVDTANKFTLIGVTSEYYLQKEAMSIKLYRYAAVDSEGVYYKGNDAGMSIYIALTAGYKVLTILDGTGATWAETYAEYGVAYDADQHIVFVPGAKIGEKPYPNLAAAVSAAMEGETVSLVRDSSESDVLLNGKSIILDEDEYVFTGSFTGSGTLVLPDGTLLKSPSSDRWAAGWTGTVWVKDLTTLTGESIQSGTTYGSTSFEPNDYGNINSTVKFTGVKGYFRANNVENYTIQPALELEDDGATPGLLLYNGWGYNSNVQCYTSIRELKGSGTLEADNTTPASSVLLQVQNWDDFTGTLTLPKKTVVFGSTLPVQTEVDGGGFVAVQSGASVEVPAGKTWTVGSGVVVYGNLSLGTGAAIVNTTAANTWIKCGTGKVTLNALGDLPATPASNWAGTVVIPAHTTNTALELNDYGVAGSTVEIPGMSDGWLKAPGSGTVTINPNLRLTGTMLLDDMSAREYSFQTISGNGSLQVTDSDCTSVSIAKIAADFEGSITNTSGKPMTIATVDLAAAPSIPSKVLTTSGTNITVTSVTVDGTPTYPSGATVVLSKDDGVYVIRTGTIFSVY